MLASDFGVPEADVAVQNGGGIRNDSIIPAGDITELDTFAMVPFPNFVTVFPEISRDTFKAVLENAVSRIDPPAAPGGSGRFAQAAGFSFVFDTTGDAMLIDSDGTVLVPGTRVQEVVLEGGTVLVTGGSVVAGDPISVAVVDFTARGGDQYPWGGAPFTVLGISYQQALSAYIQSPTADGGLGGLISAADYPEGGEGRITQLP
jgi:5'-nucleotidase